jgi:hypothetical protein
MATVTVEIPDAVSETLRRADNRLPELLARGLKQPEPQAEAYRYVLEFLAANPDPEQIRSFRPTRDTVIRLRELISRERQNQITAEEKAELDEYDKIEHIVRMLKITHSAT